MQLVRRVQDGQLESKRYFIPLIQAKFQKLNSQVNLLARSVARGLNIKAALSA
jgi:hypothetical protein